jgi:hypothetical protein
VGRFTDEIGVDYDIRVRLFYWFVDAGALEDRGGDPSGADAEGPAGGEQQAATGLGDGLINHRLFGPRQE